MFQKFFQIYYVLFCFAFFSVEESFSQNDYKAYHNYINKGKVMKDGNLTIDFYKKAFNAAKPFPKDILSLSFQYYKKGNLKAANKYFIKAVSHGYQFETDKEMSQLPYKIEYDNRFKKKYEVVNNAYADFMSEMFRRNLKKARKTRKRFLKNIDPIQNETYEVLLQNEYYFQKVRLDLLPEKEIEESEYSTLTKYLNTGNSYLMLELLKSDKFPQRAMCSRFNEQSVSLLLNHAIAGFVDEEDAKEFVNLLWNQVGKGNLLPYDYAKAYDHYVSWYVNDEMTYFGTTLIMIDGEMTFSDVLYPKKLNTLREKYWLMSIEDFSKLTRIKLPKNY